MRGLMESRGTRIYENEFPNILSSESGAAFRNNVKQVNRIHD
jgi:hypothetical protein